MERSSFDKNYILSELDRLSEKVSIPVKLFIIGGLALIHFGLKEATKDIDVVVLSKDELDVLVRSLKSLGYTTCSPLTIAEPYKKMAASKILENRDGFRWDIFHRKVCGALTFSTGMVSRATDFYSKKLLKVMLASKEDIFLFKGITERETDLEDMRLLAESGLDWKVIEKECQYQSDLSGILWENALLQNLIDLREKHRITSPIEKTLERVVEEKLIEDALIQAVKQGYVTIKMIYKNMTSRDVKLPEHLIRKHVKRMEEKGLLKIDRSRRPYKLTLT